MTDDFHKHAAEFLAQELRDALEEEDRRRRADFMDRLAFYGLCGGLLFLLCLLVSTMLWWALY